LKGKEVDEVIAAIKRGRSVPCRLRDFSTEHSFCGGKLKVEHEAIDSSHLSDLRNSRQATSPDQAL